MKHPIIAGAVATMLLAATGCSGSDVSKGPASYLAVSASKVAFIQWRTTSRGHVQGMITESSVGGSGPAQTLSVSSAPFSGTMTGNSVRLTFAMMYFLRAHAHGTIKGSALTMAVPRSDGTVERVRFRQADRAEYSRAIAALRTKVRRAALQAANQQTSQRGQPAHAQAEQSAQRTLNALYKESSIALGGRLASALARLADDVRAGRSHLATEMADASGDNKYCGAAFKVTGDAQTVDGALQNAEGAVLALMPDMLAVRRDAATATAYLRHLDRSGLPAPSLAPNVISNAGASLTQAIITANSYIREINAIDARAHAFAVRVATGRCSGARSGSSVHSIPLLHLSLSAVPPPWLALAVVVPMRTAAMITKIATASNIAAVANDAATPRARMS